MISLRKLPLLDKRVYLAGEVSGLGVPDAPRGISLWGNGGPRRRHRAWPPAGLLRCAHHGALAHVLNERNAQFGVATMCIGMGQGVATVLERVN